jgi:hypothetical protein
MATLQGSARCVHSQALDGMRWRRAGFASKTPGEMARAHAGQRGKLLDAVIMGQVAAHMVEQRAEAALGPLQFKQW